jgi:hypothetical protein
MGRIWDWLRPKKLRETPESAFRVEADDLQISVEHAGALAQAVQIRDLQGVAIETNESGPIGIDCWWLLFGADDKLVVAFPQGANGEKSAVERLMKLPGFDFDAMIAAMASTGTDVFPVWRVGRPPVSKHFDS